ncbi:hypothetical protein PWY87_31040 [Kribbella solani]|uniref:hypothetical protein n=1 Tax=Kribbella solani TaxID=236067 RepID=UPI0029ABCDB4|nr:hypothetical protein [Kribbella solani]MDX3006153.1 hypothetical protein [Kribbella solani]
MSQPARVDLITTDHHPRDYSNSIYHGYLEGGALHRTDGTIVDKVALDADAPSQVELTTVLAADSVWDGEPMTHCWTIDLRRGEDGSLAAVLLARRDTPERPEDAFAREHPVPDHRFFYARLAPGGTWQVRQLAKAGHGLLTHENDYTGLVAIDPYDLDSLYVSTPIDPRDGTALEHHEIFHGRTADAGIGWTWTPVTERSIVDNLRPIVAAGDPGRVPLLWFRGTMTASQHYACEVVLLESPRGR